MKKMSVVFILVAALLALTVSIAQAVAPDQASAPEMVWTQQSNNNGQACTTIQSGELVTSDGSLITTGYDEWGYNYQAHMFNGTYCDAYQNDGWCQPFKDIELMMKWNDAWLSKVDCSGDGFLDRHHGLPNYRGSGAWLTNHQKGDYEQDGKSCKWEYFVKIVAAPADATLIRGIWYSADDTEIGPEIWGEFAIIQEVDNNPCAGDHGLEYLSPHHAGFGGW